MSEVDRSTAAAGTPEAGRTRLTTSWKLPAVAVALALSIAMIGSGGTTPVANWRFGKIEVTNLGERRVKIYTSLRNHGTLSQEPTALFVVKLDESQPVEKPAIDLSDRTTGKAVSVVETEIQIPERIGANATSYRLLLTVGQTTTDMMPIVDGQPVPDSAERRKFQK